MNVAYGPGELKKFLGEAARVSQVSGNFPRERWTQQKSITAHKLQGVRTEYCLLCFTLPLNWSVWCLRLINVNILELHKQPCTRVFILLFTRRVNRKAQFQSRENKSRLTIPTNHNGKSTPQNKRIRNRGRGSLLESPENISVSKSHFWNAIRLSCSKKPVFHHDIKIRKGKHLL